MSAWGYGAKGGKEWGAKGGGKDWGAKGGGKDWGSKGGKDAGKGKDAPAKGPELARTRLSAEKFVGTVEAWKGRFGWIKPAEEVAHEKAKDRNGNLYVAMVDLQGVEALEVGAPVKFHIFEDTAGLGAEEVEQTGPGNPALAGKGKAAGKGDAGAKGWGAPSYGKDGGAKGGWGASSYGKDGGGAKGGWGAPSYGKDTGAKGGYGAGAGSWGGKDSSKGADSWGGKDSSKGAGSWGGKDSWGGKGGKDSWGAPKGVQTGYGKGGGYGKDSGKGKDGGKDGGKVSKSGAPRGKGHTLPRTRITAEKFAGTVAAWKGKYGWIAPAEAVQHEKAAKNNGSIFVSMDDIQGNELTVGASVAFHIAEDSSGLLAEEVVQS